VTSIPQSMHSGGVPTWHAFAMGSADLDETMVAMQTSQQGGMQPVPTPVELVGSLMDGVTTRRRLGFKMLSLSVPAVLTQLCSTDTTDVNEHCRKLLRLAARVALAFQFGLQEVRVPGLLHTRPHDVKWQRRQHHSRHCIRSDMQHVISTPCV
jgi:hypothetical protein